MGACLPLHPELRMKSPLEAILQDRGPLENGRGSPRPSPSEPASGGPESRRPSASSQADVDHLEYTPWPRRGSSPCSCTHDSSLSGSNGKPALYPRPDNAVPDRIGARCRPMPPEGGWPQRSLEGRSWPGRAPRPGTSGPTVTVCLSSSEVYTGSPRSELWGPHHQCEDPPGPALEPDAKQHVKASTN